MAGDYCVFLWVNVDEITFSFLERKRCFQFSPAKCGRSLNHLLFFFCQLSIKSSAHFLAFDKCLRSEISASSLKRVSSELTLIIPPILSDEVDTSQAFSHNTSLTLPCRGESCWYKLSREI